MLTHCLTNYKYMRQPLSPVFYSYLPFLHKWGKWQKTFRVGSRRTVVTSPFAVYLLYIQTEEPSKGHKGTEIEGSGTSSQDARVWRRASLEDTQRVSYRATVCSELTSCSLFALLSPALPKRHAETQPRHTANGDKACLLPEIPFRGGQQAPG